MANTYIITSTEVSVIFDVNGRAATFNRQGELRATTIDLSGSKVSILDEKALLQPKYRIPFEVILGTDSINVNGQTDFTDAAALLDVLQRVFFSDNKPKLGSKFGRNSDIDGNTSPEDLWDGGGLYTGFNCTEAETLEFFSSDIEDTGALVSSGTTTGGSSTTLEDSGATFITDGVAVGDLIINDSKQFHGIVSSVDSETLLTVFDFTNGRIGEEVVGVGTCTV